MFGIHGTTTSLRFWTILTFCFWLGPEDTTWAGQLFSHTITSEKLAGNVLGDSPIRSFDVLVPDGYAGSQTNYPVVYWFPGGGQNSKTEIDIDAIEAEFTSGRSAPAIVVFMEGRTNYGSSAFISSEPFGDWEGFMADEVIPFVEAKYRAQTTQDKRGIMGYSLGGFSAMMLPLRLPNTFGAFGGNDPSFTLISGMVRDFEEVPEGLIIDETFVFDEWYEDFANTVEDNVTAPLVHAIYGQIAAGFAPNPDIPQKGDLPFSADGFWQPEPRALWRAYDWLDPDSLELHREALDGLSTIHLLNPLSSSQRIWNAALVPILQAAGLPAQETRVPGGHDEDRHDRFTTLLSSVTWGLEDIEPVVLTQNSHREEFDAALGTDDRGGVALPSGWSVSDGQQFVFRNRTNTPVNGGDVRAVGIGPHILNIGEVEAADRSIGVFVPGKTAGATIQFLADVSELDATGFQLQFDLETWGEAEAITVMAALDFGNGFEQTIELGAILPNSAESAEGLVLLDGTSPSRVLTFDSGIATAPISNAQALRIWWLAEATPVPELVLTPVEGETPPDPADQLPPWSFGLDNVVLNFIFDSPFGDFSRDGIINAADIDVLSAAIRDSGDPITFDLNGDGLVDTRDRDYWVNEIAVTLVGDANLDKDVDFADFLLLGEGFGTTGTGWALGDFDGDGSTVFNDFLLFSENFGLAVETQVLATVPEPNSSTLGMIMISAALVAIRRQRFVDLIV